MRSFFLKTTVSMAATASVTEPMLTAKAKTDVEEQLAGIQKKLIGIEQRYRSEAVRCRQDIQDLESRLLKTTTDDLRKRISKFAEEKGYDFIFCKSSGIDNVLYANEAYDVTDEVVKALNKKMNAKKHYMKPAIRMLTGL